MIQGNLHKTYVKIRSSQEGRVGEQFRDENIIVFLLSIIDESFIQLSC